MPPPTITQSNKMATRFEIDKKNYWSKKAIGPNLCSFNRNVSHYALYPNA